LKRIGSFYGSSNQFILTSATIGNPDELAENLIEAEIAIIKDDGSPKGEKHFGIYNPPIINSELRIREKHYVETTKLGETLYRNRNQTIIFCQTRRSVELMVVALHEKLALDSDARKSVRGYRSGYLAEYRRRLERGLKNGDIRIIIATTALELGIDCGQIDAAILDGFPGTIAGTWQQAGRAGRKSNASIAILVVSENPLDQFLARNPDYLFSQNPEKALINPNNDLILLDHIKCAVFELPFSDGEAFGSVPYLQLKEFLEVLQQTGTVINANGSSYWASRHYPASDISLRNASAKRLNLVVKDENNEKIIGQVDEESAYWMTHPEAVYLHDGESYLVENLDMEINRIDLRPFAGEYYTKPHQNRNIEVTNILLREHREGGKKIFGELLIEERVTGFHKVSWVSYEILETKELTLPTTTLSTSGYIYCFNKSSIDQLRKLGFWRNDRQDYGPQWKILRKKTLSRDQYRCQSCGHPFETRQLHIHHKIPLRMFRNSSRANQLSNLITLCTTCHASAEKSVRVRSGLAGLAYLLRNIAPLFLMCDKHDLGVHFDPESPTNDGEATFFLYDRVPGGLGFSKEFYYLHETIMENATDLVNDCDCFDGCPGCVGPGGEFGSGSKKETIALIEIMKS
jgi:DEAD/DEAH box helicase domain-containing protein